MNRGKLLRQWTCEDGTLVACWRLALPYGGADDQPARGPPCAAARRVRAAAGHRPPARTGATRGIGGIRGAARPGHYGTRPGRGTPSCGGGGVGTEAAGGGGGGAGGEGAPRPGGRGGKKPPAPPPP